MPTRRLARSDAERDAALRNGKSAKDQIPAMPVIPYTAGTATHLDTFQPIYRTKYVAVTTAKNNQTTLSIAVEASRKKVIMYELDFLDALNKAIRREEFLPSVRTLYRLDVNATVLPRITSENDITTWGLNINDGETARVAGGGAPITFPSLAQVNAELNNYISLNQQQEVAKAQYDIAQEALAALNPEADKLILKMWNETETAFDEGDKASMRRKARQWGVVYVPIPGEALNPNDFSMTGTVTDSATGLPLADVDLHIMPADIVVLTDGSGIYFVGVQDPGSYSIIVHKVGYLEKIIPDVIVTEGAITTRNITLAIAADTGTLSGNVNVPGFPPATITIPSTGQTTTTDAMGNFTITGVPIGVQTVQCFLNSDPANIKTQTPTIIAGATVTVNFNFP